MADLLIRKATKSDVDAVRTLVQTVLEETYPGIWAVGEAPALNAEDWSRSRVAVAGGRIVGVVLTEEEWVSDLWVAAEHRGVGTGRRLLQAAEEELAGRGCIMFRLRVVKTNALAVRFYLKNGWSVSREFPHETLPVEMLELAKADVEKIVQTLPLRRVVLPAKPFSKFLTVFGERFSCGGSYLVAFEVGESKAFDHYVSSEKLAKAGLLDLLLTRPEITAALSKLNIPATGVQAGLSLQDAAALSETWTRWLLQGGAYSSGAGDGQMERALVFEVCDAMFGLHFQDVILWESFAAWTPWFQGIAWDMTNVLFDLRRRRFWIFVVTDTD